MRELIEEVFAGLLGGEALDIRLDAAPLAGLQGDLMITTDGFIVQPLEFPGGDIGSLAVHGTCNDLAVAGARPRYLTLNAFLEEGLELELLRRLVTSLARAAATAGVAVVAGDTKVVRRGEGGGLYLATTGVGTRMPGFDLSLERIVPGDRLLVSGPLGDHGIAVMLAREQFGLHGDLQSDSALVLPLVETLQGLAGVRFLRDPTRGGLVSVCHEISRYRGCSVRLDAASIPVNEQVVSVCDMLGYDPYYLACEGRVLAVVAADQAEQVLQRWRGLPAGSQSALVGSIVDGPRQVVLVTELGGERLMQELEEDPLPRIC
jgi:hydrogenase expression/formation protein HypE